MSMSCGREDGDLRSRDEQLGDVPADQLAELVPEHPRQRLVALDDPTGPRGIEADEADADRSVVEREPQQLLLPELVRGLLAVQSQADLRGDDLHQLALLVRGRPVDRELADRPAGP
jgi:hypothetical protein